MVDLPLDAPPAIVIDRLHSRHAAGEHEEKQGGDPHEASVNSTLRCTGHRSCGQASISQNRQMKSPEARSLVSRSKSFSERPLSWVRSFVESTSMTSAMAFRLFS